MADDAHQIIISRREPLPRGQSPSEEDVEDFAKSLGESALPVIAYWFSWPIVREVLGQFDGTYYCELQECVIAESRRAVESLCRIERSEESKDGPDPLRPDLFRWEGEIYHGLPQGRALKLMRFLLPRIGETVPWGQLVGPRLSRQ